MIGDGGAIEIAAPRDRNGSFEPQLVAESLPQRRLGVRPGSTVSMIVSSASLPGASRFARSRRLCQVTDAVLEAVRESHNRRSTR